MKTRALVTESKLIAFLVLARSQGTEILNSLGDSLHRKFELTGRQKFNDNHTPPNSPIDTLYGK